MANSATKMERTGMKMIIQIANPPQGYMHNDNVTPFAMMKESPLTPEKYSKTSYIYNATREAPRHQRAEMETELLDAAHAVTVEQAIDLAFNPQVFHAEKWQRRLEQAWTNAPAKRKSEAVTEVSLLIQYWNRRSEADSAGALAFYAFKKGLGEALARRVDPPVDLTDNHVLDGLDNAVEWLQKNFDDIYVSYGRYFRVGRQGSNRTWPAGGGTVAEAGMATVRAIGFSPVGKEMVGHSQTSTQIVLMTDPPESYTVVPLGASDRKESGHWEDQSEKLFSRSRAARTYFMNRDELLKHVTVKKTLKRD